MGIDDGASWLERFAGSLLQVLPRSPFAEIVSLPEAVLPQWLRWLNWFVPVAEILSVFAAWLVAYGLYLLYRIILRWIKAVS